MKKRELRAVDFLNTLHIDECPGVRIGDVLGGELDYFESRDSLRQIKDVLREAKNLYKLKYFNYSIEIKGINPTNLFFGCGKRKDADDKMYALVSCVNNAIVVKEINQFNPDFRIRFDLLKKWDKLMKNGIVSFKKRVFCCLCLFWVWNYYDVLEKKINLKNMSIENVVMSGEGYCISVYLSERFKNMHIKTIGYQMVLMGRQNYRSFLDSFDNRLVWGKYTMDQARMLGVDTNNFVPVGNPINIFDEIEEPKNYRKNVVGLYVNGGSRGKNLMFEYEINILQEFCMKNNLKLLIKIHPNYDKKEYEKDLDYDVVGGVFGRECDNIAFMNSADVLIVNNSTTLVEAYSKWKPCFQIINRKIVQSTFFDDVDIFKFENLDQLQKLYDSINTDEFREKMKWCHDYFVGEGNTRENYIKAFEKCGVI